MTDERIFITAGLILASGALAGTLARLLRLPRVTGYIGAGVALGPHAWDALPHVQAETLARSVTDLTMALVLFVLGGGFRIDRIRGRERPILVLSSIEAGVTFALVAGVALLVLRERGAILLGIMAIAVAPATTLAVLQEYEAEGPCSHTLQLVTALSNVWSIFFFEVGLLALVAWSGGEAGAERLAWSVLGSVAYGLVAGHVLIFLQSRAGFGSYALPLLTVLLLTIGVCELTQVPSMLVFLVTGAVVVNRSRFFEPISAAMEHFAQPAYAAFFVLSGWHLDFAMLAADWLAIGLYVITRAAGKILGARLGMDAGKLHFGPAQDRRPWLGLALMSQAGAAVALAQLAMRYDEPLGAQLLNIVLGGVVLFELIGPLLVRRTVVAAGEVRMGRLLARPAAGTPPWLRSVWHALRGRRLPSRREAASLTAADLMRPGVPPLRADAPMDEILRYANHSPIDVFPVAGPDGTLRGMVKLRDLSQFIYDPDAAAVIADDLISIPPAQAAVEVSSPMDETAAHFGQFPGDAAPIVDDRERLHYQGVLDRAEVFRVMRHLRHG